jgi:hypothetical protein
MVGEAGRVDRDPAAQQAAAGVGQHRRGQVGGAEYRHGLRLVEQPDITSGRDVGERCGQAPQPQRYPQSGPFQPGQREPGRRHAGRGTGVGADPAVEVGHEPAVIPGQHARFPDQPGHLGRGDELTAESGQPAPQFVWQRRPVIRLAVGVPVSGRPGQRIGRTVSVSRTEPHAAHVKVGPVAAEHRREAGDQAVPLRGQAHRFEEGAHGQVGVPVVWVVGQVVQVVVMELVAAVGPWREAPGLGVVRGWRAK